MKTVLKAEHATDGAVRPPKHAQKQRQCQINSHSSGQCSSRMSPATVARRKNMLGYLMIAAGHNCGEVSRESPGTTRLPDSFYDSSVAEAWSKRPVSAMKTFHN